MKNPYLAFAFDLLLCASFVAFYQLLWAFGDWLYHWEKIAFWVAIFTGAFFIPVQLGIIFWGIMWVIRASFNNTTQYIFLLIPLLLFFILKNFDFYYDKLTIVCLSIMLIAEVVCTFLIREENDNRLRNSNQ